MIHIADYDFLSNDIELPFFLGEKKILKLNYKGFRCHIDIFKTPELSSHQPPLEKLKESGYSIAQCISYPVSKKLPRIAVRQGYICYTLRQYRRLYIDTDQDFDHYLKRFKGKTLSTIRRKSRKLTESNPSGLSFRSFTSEKEITEFIGIAHEISKKTYQFRLLNQGLQVTEQYVNDYLLKAREKRIIGLVLYAEDRPVAYNLCPIYGDGTMIYYYTGFDPDYNRYSPGTVLQYKTIETACGLEGVKKYDFCTGEGKHKELFTDHYKDCADIYYFPLKASYLMVILCKVVYDAFLDVIKFLVRGLGKTDRIKKMIRSRAGKA